MVVDRTKNYTLAEIRQAKKVFFENKREPERYSIRKNHLIVQGLESKEVKVWQFHTLRGSYRLSFAWELPTGTTMKIARAMVEEMLSAGLLPVYDWS